MTPEDEVARALPHPPQPAPGRRRASIEMALRRFDAGDAGNATTAASGARPAGWWPRIAHPQVAALASVVLVAIIGLPLMWMSADQDGGFGNGRRSGELAEVAPQVAREPASADTLQPSFEVASAGEVEAPSAPATALADANAEPADAPAEAARGRAPTARLAPAIDKPAPSDLNRGDSVRFAESPAARANVAADRQLSSAETTAGAIEGEDQVVITGARLSESLSRIPNSSVSASRRSSSPCTIEDPADSASCRTSSTPAVRSAPGRSEAHLSEGLDLARAGDLYGAISAFDRAIKVAPRSSAAYLNRGLAYRRLGRLDRALADLDRAVTYAPRSAAPYRYRSQLRRQQGDTRGADADDKRASEFDRE